MSPGHLPAADLIPFIREAGRRGIYLHPRLQETAIRLLVDNSPSEQRPRTVDDVARRLRDVRDPFSSVGGPVPAARLKPGSLAAYRSRATKVLSDFYRWQGDFDTWISSLDNKKNQPRQLGLTAASSPLVKTPLKLPSGQIAELLYASTLESKDLGALAGLLRSLAEHLDAQAAALAVGDLNE